MAKALARSETQHEAQELEELKEELEDSQQMQVQPPPPTNQVSRKKEPRNAARDQQHGRCCFSSYPQPPTRLSLMAYRTWTAREGSPGKCGSAPQDQPISQAWHNLVETVSQHGLRGMIYLISFASP